MDPSKQGGHRATSSSSYPAELIVHLLPCVHVSGLVAERTPSYPTLAHPTSVYPNVCHAIVEAFAPQARPRLWYAPGSPPRLHTVMVDYAHVLPPARMRAGARITDVDAKHALQALPPRSPLSPLFPGGPLFPDGIVSPSWIRKHTEYMPGVHLAFFCLPASTEATLQADTALIEAIIALRTSLAPRGIKVMVVLLCEPASLLAGQEARLHHIRRAAGLEARGTMLVFNAHDMSRLPAFLTDVYATASQHTREHYREHARHVRRNRARYPPPPSVTQPIMQAAAQAHLLRTPSPILSPPGWHVRTHYKLAVLAELQGEYAEADTQYTEAYEALLRTYLADTKLLAPRTRRWAEAKVLVDTLAFKRIKGALYRGDEVVALRIFAMHQHEMSVLSTGWGIGASTPEFWAWRAKQYALMATLLQDAGLTTSCFEPGVLRYHAALCTMQRAAYATDTSVDVRALVVHALSLAYDTFRHAQRGRLAHMTATRLAGVYQETEPAQALQYLERNLRWYRRETWTKLRYAVAYHAWTCARASHDPAATMRLALELAPVAQQYDVSYDTSDEATSSETVLPLDPGAASHWLHVCAVFARGTLTLPGSMAWQLRIEPWATSRLPSWPWRTLRVYARESDTPVCVVTYDAQAPTTQVTMREAIAWPAQRPGTGTTSWTWADKAPLWVQGAMAVSQASDVTFSHVVLTLQTPLAPVDLAIDVDRDAPCVWYVPTTHQRLPLPPRPDVRTLHAVAEHVAINVPTTMYPGEVVGITMPTTPTTVRVAPEAWATGAAWLDETSAQEAMDSVAASTLWLRAPSILGTFRVHTHATSTETHGVHVQPLLHVQSHVHWRDASDGRVLLHVEYLGTDALQLEHVYVAVAPELGIQAGAVWGAPTPNEAPAFPVWSPRTTATWIAPLQVTYTAADIHNDATTASTLVVQWRRPECDQPWPCETHVPIPALTPPPWARVRVHVTAPPTVVVGEAIWMTMHVLNQDAYHVADATIDVEVPDTALAAGPRKVTCSMLLPGEERTYTVALRPQRMGPYRLPLVRALALVPQQEPQRLTVPMDVHTVMVQAPTTWTPDHPAIPAPS